VKACESNNLLKISKTKTLLANGSNIIPANSSSSKTEVVTPNDAVDDLDLISDKERNQKEPTMPYNNNIDVNDANDSEPTGIGSHLENNNAPNANQGNKMTFQVVSVSPSKK
jgi:hypothetical protein